MNIFEYATSQATEKLSFFSRYMHFLNDYRKFIALNSTDRRFSPSLINQYPCLRDWTTNTTFESHYMYHPAWAARAVRKINPKKHIDISSSLTFATMLSAFIPVEFYDYRPARLFLDNLISKKGDLMNLPFKTNSIESLSCMHTIEHIGLGRYGVPLDPNGDLKAIAELKRVVKKGGSLLFVTPIGKPTLRFNAHRIYSYSQIISYFEGFILKEFSLLPDNAYKVGMIKNATKTQADKQSWGCGCFWFIKE